MDFLYSVIEDVTYLEDDHDTVHSYIMCIVGTEAEAVAAVNFYKTKESHSNYKYYYQKTEFNSTFKQFANLKCYQKCQVAIQITKNRITGINWGSAYDTILETDYREPTIMGYTESEDETSSVLVFDFCDDCSVPLRRKDYRSQKDFFKMQIQKLTTIKIEDISFNV